MPGPQKVTEVKHSQCAWPENHGHSITLICPHEKETSLWLRMPIAGAHHWFRVFVFQSHLFMIWGLGKASFIISHFQSFIPTAQDRRVGLPEIRRLVSLSPTLCATRRKLPQL